MVKTAKEKEKACTKKKMSIVMGEWKRKKLKMRSGKRVTNYKQAVAIGLSEARRYCSQLKKKTIKRKKTKQKKSTKH